MYLLVSGAFKFDMGTKHHPGHGSWGSLRRRVGGCPEPDVAPSHLFVQFPPHFAQARRVKVIPTHENWTPSVIFIFLFGRVCLLQFSDCRLDR